MSPTNENPSLASHWLARRAAVVNSDPHSQHPLALILAPVAYGIADARLKAFVGKLLVHLAEQEDQLFEEVTGLLEAHRKSKRGRMHRNARILGAYIAFEINKGRPPQTKAELRRYITDKRKAELADYARAIQNAGSPNVRDAIPEPSSIYQDFPDDDDKKGWNRMWQASLLSWDLANGRAGRPSAGDLKL